MSVDSENSFLLPTPQDSRTSCIFQATEERDEAPGGGEESVLEMLSFSKFSDLETWLCMPSSLLLPGPLESTRTSSSSSSSSSSSHAPGLSSRPVSCSSSSLPTSDSRRSTYSEPAEGDAAFRSPDFLTLVKEMPSLATPPAPLLSSTPSSTGPGSVTSAADAQGGVNIRKRRRLAASPGGLHWNSAGSPQVFS
ncbi:hypothetical protein D4764_01G0018330 [Takifugu flavidus]|uniref:Uncharacterized protein n=1 Tax=Takifugu flavidus TaxID=433684 RepID=A0A5C6PT75_9TELE|nr:hypothetical protein D4764_01G0018330 [Takifugu flavidus]